MSSVAGVFAPRLIERFARVEHNIDVHVGEGPTATLPRMLIAREADLAIVPLGYVRNLPEIEWAPLWDEPFKLVIPLTHRLAGAAEVSLADLEGESVITPGSGDGARGLSPEMAAVLDHAGVRVGTARRVASPYTLVSMVRSGLGLGVLSELGLALTGSDGVCVAPFTEPGAVRRTVLAWSREARISPSSQRLSEFIRAHRTPAGTTRADDRAR